MVVLKPTEFKVCKPHKPNNFNPKRLDKPHTWYVDPLCICE